MSRLIEALRKAEEEKRKDEQTQKNESPDSVAEESTELAPSKLEKDTSDPSDENELEAAHSIDFELEPTEELSVDVASKNALELEPASSNQETETAQVAAESYADLETSIEKVTDGSPDKPNEPNSSESQDYSRRQTDEPLKVIIPEKEEKKPSKKPKLFWFFIIALLSLLIICVLYFFFLQNTDTNKYSSNLDYSQSRGFLGDTNAINTNSSQEKPDNTGNVSKPTLEKISSATGNSNLLSSIQNITEAISENTVETLSNVTGLLEGDNNTANLTVEAEQAVPVFQISRSKTVKGASSSLSYAQDNVQGGESDAARMEYRELLRNQPTNRSALIGLAQLESKAGNAVLAKEQYEKLLQLNPQDPVAQVGLLESTQPYDVVAFEAELRTLASAHPRQAFIPFKLGNLYASQNRWSDAKNMFESALESAYQYAPKSVKPDYAFNLAVSLEKTGQPQRALEYYLIAKELSESSPVSFDSRILSRRIELLEEGL